MPTRVQLAWPERPETRVVIFLVYCFKTASGNRNEIDVQQGMAARLGYRLLKACSTQGKMLIALAVSAIAVNVASVDTVAGINLLVWE